MFRLGLIMANENLSAWFGPSRASYLTLPRAFMESMPDEWQEQIAELLNEYDYTFINQPPLGTRVQTTDLTGKLVKTPEWIINYRRPDLNAINRCKTSVFKG